MLWSTVAPIFLLGIALCNALVNVVPLNPASSRSGDIALIQHDTDNRLVTISLTRSRTCENPTFMMRLSGPSVYLLTKQSQTYTPPAKRINSGVGQFLQGRDNVMVYTYPPIVDAGTYFLEVIIMMCNELNPLEIDNVCLESAGSRVISAPYSVDLTASAASPYGHWQLPSALLWNATVLPTRYQGQPGIGGTGTERHMQYEWVDGPNWAGTLKAAFPDRPARVCVIGASHARYITKWGEELDPTRSSVVFVHIQSEFPTSFQSVLSGLPSLQCDFAVVGYGQWSLSYMADPLCNGECYETSMRAVVAAAKSYTGPTKFFFRSMNYNGLGLAHVSCPAYDHRVPPLVDMYNSILRRVTKEAGAPFIDTTHIVGPLWDAADDYWHPNGKVFKALTGWILHAIAAAGPASNALGTHGKGLASAVQSEATSLQPVGIVPVVVHHAPASPFPPQQPYQHPPPLRGGGLHHLPLPHGQGQGPTVPVAVSFKGSLVRFSDAPTVYLLEGDVLRPFHRRAFLEMQHQFGRETVMDAARRREFTVGPAIVSTEAGEHGRVVPPEHVVTVVSRPANGYVRGG